MTAKAFARYMRTQQRQDQLAALEQAPVADVPGGDIPEAEPAPVSDPVVADPHDFSWAEELSDFRDGLHGLQLKELLGALRDGIVPDALLDKLQVELIDGDRRWKASLNDARNGAMMRAKFQQLTAAQAQREREWDSEKTEFLDYLKGWKDDPDLLLAGMERLGLPFDAAARKYSQRLQEIDHLWKLEQTGQVAQGTTKRLWEQQQLERENAELKRFRARDEQARQQATEKQQQDQAVHLIEQAGAQALTQIGIDPQDDTNWRIFRRHVFDMYQRTRQMPSREDIVEAAKMTKEEIAQYIREYDETDAKKRQPVAPRNADVAPPDMSQARPRGSMPKGMTTKEWSRRNLYGPRSRH